MICNIYIYIYIFLFNRTGAWFDPSTQGPLGTDGKDWNKLAGVSTFSYFRPSSWAKNKNSALVAWRPDPERERYQLAAYTNDRRGGFEFVPLMTVDALEYFEIRVDIQRRDRTVSYQVADRRVFVSMPLRVYSKQLPVGPWFGGNRTSPNTHTILCEMLNIK